MMKSKQEIAALVRKLERVLEEAKVKAIRARIAAELDMHAGEQ